MSQTRLELLNELFHRWCKEKVTSINKLPASGSSREYYRISGSGSFAIGVINTDREENEAFIEFSRHFRSRGLPVPQIYLVDLDHNAYLQEDLGDVALFDYIFEIRNNGTFPEELTRVYKDVLTELQKFQILGAVGLNYSACYPRASFDRQSMQWDLSYFKYLFLVLVARLHRRKVHFGRPGALLRPLIVMRMSCLGSSVNRLPTVWTAVQMYQEIEPIILLQLVLEEAYQNLAFALLCIHFQTPPY